MYSEKSKVVVEIGLYREEPSGQTVSRPRVKVEASGIVRIVPDVLFKPARKFNSKNTDTGRKVLKELKLFQIKMKQVRILNPRKMEWFRKKNRSRLGCV